MNIWQTQTGKTIILQTVLNIKKTKDSGNYNEAIEKYNSVKQIIHSYANRMQKEDAEDMIDYFNMLINREMGGPPEYKCYLRGKN